MLQTDSQTAPVLQGDIMAVDALFKRIAERGRKIRTQNKSADSESHSRETLSAGQVRAIHKEQAKKRQDE